MSAWVRGGVLLAVAMVPVVAHGDPVPVVPAPADPVPAPVAPAPTASPLPPAATPRRFDWELFGYLRLQYIAVQNDPNVAFVGRDDGFELQNARVGVRGGLANRLGFVVAFDGAVDERLQVNTPDGKLRVALRDAFADAALGDRFVVRGGLFQAVVDPEALVADPDRELVDQPIESRGMRATEGYQTPGLPPGRSLGAAIRFDTGRRGGAAPSAPWTIGVELAVQNGADEFSANNDNDKPAVSASVVARLPRGSWVMAAARYNPRSVGDLPFRQDEDDVQATAGFRLDLGPVVLGGGAIGQRTTFPTTGGPAQTAFGGHAQLLVKLPVAQPIEVGYRFGVLDPSSLITTDRVMEHAVGAVLGVPDYRMRFQLELTHVVEQGARALSNDRAQLAAELAL